MFVQLPELGAAVVAKGATFSEVESTKSVSDVYAPVAGTVAEVNTDLADAPQRLNEDPYGDGWICVIEPADPAAVDALLDAAATALSPVRRHRQPEPSGVASGRPRS